MLVGTWVFRAQTDLIFAGEEGRGNAPRTHALGEGQSSFINHAWVPTHWIADQLCSLQMVL